MANCKRGTRPLVGQSREPRGAKRSRCVIDTTRSRHAHSTLRFAATFATHYNPDSPIPSPVMTRALASAFRIVLRFALAIALVYPATPPAYGESNAPVVLVVGDSISAGYGLTKGTGWVELLAARIDAERLPWRVVNASITGDTTAGGRARLPALLAQHKPGVVIVELGGNDGLRGGNLKSTRDNLDAMIAAVRKAGAKPVVVGMRLPPNYGPAYTRDFGAIYGDVAKSNGATLVPFFFAGFAESDEYFQPDRIHPTAAAQSKLLDNVWPVLSPLLAKAR